MLSLRLGKQYPGMNYRIYFGFTTISIVEVKSAFMVVVSNAFYTQGQFSPSSLGPVTQKQGGPISICVTGGSSSFSIMTGIQEFLCSYTVEKEQSKP